MNRRGEVGVRSIAVLIVGLATAASVAPTALDAQAPPARQGLLSLDGGRLFYQAVGTGDPIVVVHGGPGLDHRYLRPGLDVLASLGSVVYYDQRGTGRSEFELTEDAITWDAFVEDIDRLRQVLGHDRITVVGHSFGGLLALDYARRYPDRTRALILLNTVEPGPRWQAEARARQQAARTPADSAAMADLVGTEAFQARDAATMSRYYRLAFRAVVRDAARIDALDLDLDGRTARQGPEVATLLGGSMGAIDWWDSLGEVRVPTLVVHGRADAPPQAMARALADAFPRGRLAELDTGHFPWVEDPASLIEAISSFLAGAGP